MNLPDIKAVFFDLDGTLADTAPDLGGALNRLLEQRGRPPVAAGLIRRIAGDGANALVKLGFGIEPGHPDHPALREAYLAEYARGCDRNSVLFPGIDALLAHLAARGIVWGIITNKPARFTDRLLPKLGFSVPPAVVVSGDTCAHAKPHPEPMLYACRQTGIAPANVLYVGDAGRDIEAGRKAGMHTAFAAWGYLHDDTYTPEPPPDLYFADVAALAARLKTQFP